MNIPHPSTKAILKTLAVGILIFLLVEGFTHGWRPVEEAIADDGETMLGLGYMAVFTIGLGAGLISRVWFGRHFIHRKRDGNGRAKPQALALMIATGIGLHNFSEGLAISAGGRTSVGALVGSLLNNEYVTILFLSLAAGALIYTIK
jgi:zinc transporter, ZIP family